MDSVIYWTAIFPEDEIIQLLNNWGKDVYSLKILPTNPWIRLSKRHSQICEFRKNNLALNFHAARAENGVLKNEEL